MTVFEQNHLLNPGHIPLKKNHTFEAEEDGWKISTPYFYSSNVFFISDFNLNGIQYDTMQVFIDNGPLEHEGEVRTDFGTLIME